MTPLLDIFLPYQVRWITDSAKLKLGEKSRRIGFTYAQSYAAVEGRVSGRSDYWHSSADMTASKEFIRECEKWAKAFNVAAQTVDAEEVIDDEKITTIELKFANGRKIAAGSSNPKFFRSKGGDVGLDEFAFHVNARELFKAAHATAIVWGHGIGILSTHDGEGSYFNAIIHAADKGELKASHHRVTIMDAVEQGFVEKVLRLKVRDDIARRDWLDQMRATCPDQQTWDEEFLCIPSSDQCSLLTYDLIRGCEEPNLKLWSIEDLANVGGGRQLYAGFDVGRKRDLSVLWIIERIGDVFWTRLVKVMDRVNFTAQEEMLRLVMGCSSIKRLCIDSTGIGAMLAERLRDRFGYRAEPVNFSAPVKSELAMPLLRLFQDRLLRIQADAIVREDLHKVRKIVTAANNVRLDSDRDADGHADRFWALALAYHAADAIGLPLPAPLMEKPVGF
jgi:phage FluMu gp28-like protein